LPQGNPAAVCGREPLRGERETGYVVGDEPLVKQQQPVEAAAGHFEVVRGQQDSHVAPAQVVQDGKDGLARLYIHASKGLIQQQHVRLLSKGARDEHPLLLAAR
jgi:hypothetical protein